jgi:hypothetical protein
MRKERSESRLKIDIFGLLGADANGVIAICALVLIVILLTLLPWLH